ncbi:MAG: DUF4013 domain-containing protein [Candidatus Nanoarchaeia archaeon]
MSLEALKRVFSKKIWPGFVLILIPIVEFFAMGYKILCAKTAMYRDYALPQWTNWKELFKKGFFARFIQAVWLSPPALIFAVVWFKLKAIQSKVLNMTALQELSRNINLTAFNLTNFSSTPLNASSLNTSFLFNVSNASNLALFQNTSFNFSSIFITNLTQADFTNLMAEFIFIKNLLILFLAFFIVFLIFMPASVLNYAAEEKLSAAFSLTMFRRAFTIKYFKGWLISSVWAAFIMILFVGFTLLLSLANASLPPVLLAIALLCLELFLFWPPAIVYWSLLGEHWPIEVKIETSETTSETSQPGQFY